jgi:hypothetical protein
MAINRLLGFRRQLARHLPPSSAAG